MIMITIMITIMIMMMSIHISQMAFSLITA